MKPERLGEYRLFGSHIIIEFVPMIERESYVVTTTKGSGGLVVGAEYRFDDRDEALAFFKALVRSAVGRAK